MSVAVDHVVVLVLENRSFDHLLGYLDHPSAQFDGLLRGGPYGNPGWDGGTVSASPTAKPVLPVDPDHSHDAVLEQLGLRSAGAGAAPTNQGFVTSYERKGRGLAPAAFGGVLGPLVNFVAGRTSAGAPSIAGRGPLAMACQPPGNLPALSRLAAQFAVCTRWFCSVPGETWPNRNFLHAATSDGETNIDLRFYHNRTSFELLEEHGRDWRIYHDDIPQAWAFNALWDTPQRHAKWFPVTAFAGDVAAGRLPAYSFIEPNHRPPVHTFEVAVSGRPEVSDSQHPGNNRVANDVYDTFDVASTGAETDFTRGDRLIASVYEALRANPDVFERTVLLITYDEHGGLYDHVPPPTGVPAPSPRARASLATRVAHWFYRPKASAFDFTMLGPRVPAVVVSPYIAEHTVDATVRDHASVPATLRALFAPQAPPLTDRDAWSPPFHRTLSLDVPRRDGSLPDLSAFTRAAAPQQPAGAVPGAVNPAPAVSGAAGASSARPFYQDFLDQAELVHAHLGGLGEPEAASAPRGDDAERSAGITAAFHAAAARHRGRPDQCPAPGHS